MFIGIIPVIAIVLGGLGYQYPANQFQTAAPVMSMSEAVSGNLTR